MKQIIIIVRKGEHNTLLSDLVQVLFPESEIQTVTLEEESDMADANNLSSNELHE